MNKNSYNSLRISKNPKIFRDVIEATNDMNIYTTESTT